MAASFSITITNSATMKPRNLYLPPGAKCVMISDEGDHFRVWLGINKLDAPPGKRFGTYIALYPCGKAERCTTRPDSEEEDEVMEPRNVLL
jgi:hypothetical protein